MSKLNRNKSNKFKEEEEDSNRITNGPNVYVSHLIPLKYVLICVENLTDSIISFFLSIATGYRNWTGWVRRGVSSIQCTDR